MRAFALAQPASCNKCIKPNWFNLFETISPLVILMPAGVRWERMSSIAPAISKNYFSDRRRSELIERMNESVAARVRTVAAIHSQDD